MFVLSAVVTKCSSKKVSGVSGIEIRDALLAMGFSADITLKVLSDMCAVRYIFTSSHGPATFEATYVPSRLGGHIIRNMITQFVFLENVLMDTFIDDDDVWKTLYDQTTAVYAERAPSRRIEKRIDRVETFYQLMETTYAALRDEAARRSLGAEWLGDPFKEGRSQFKINVDRVRNSARRNYGNDNPSKRPAKKQKKRG